MARKTVKKKKYANKEKFIYKCYQGYKRAGLQNGSFLQLRSQWKFSKDMTNDVI